MVCQSETYIITSHKTIVCLVQLLQQLPIFDWEHYCRGCSQNTQQSSYNSIINIYLSYRTVNGLTFIV